MTDGPQGFDAMKSRLDEILEEVSAEGVSLDDALALYEEAVKLGLAACDVSEADILVPEDTEPADGESEANVEAPSGAEGASEPSDGMAAESSGASEPHDDASTEEGSS